MNTIPHPDEESIPYIRDMERKRQLRQLRWAHRTKSGFEGLVKWYAEHPEDGRYDPSEAKRKQYEAACRILVEHAIVASL